MLEALQYEQELWLSEKGELWLLWISSWLFVKRKHKCKREF
jgi:hypothetical protein